MSEERMVESIETALRELGAPEEVEAGDRLPVTHSRDVTLALCD
jgi:hypothetical protein